MVGLGESGFRQGDHMAVDLIPSERVLLQSISQRAKPRYVRRARLILGKADGLNLEAIGEWAGLSLRRTRYWLAEFDARRMEVFPEAVLDAAGEVVVAAATPEECEAEGALPTVRVDALAETHEVDLCHAQHVAGLALQLYDLAQEIHGLPPRWSQMLAAACTLHEIGGPDSSRRQGTQGAAILEGVALEGFGSAERDRIAAALALKSRPSRFTKAVKSL
jgi:hypothetical protein